VAASRGRPTQTHQVAAPAPLALTPPPPPRNPPPSGGDGSAGNRREESLSVATGAAADAATGAQPPPPSGTRALPRTCSAGDALAATTTSARSIWSDVPVSPSTYNCELIFPPLGLVAQARCDPLAAVVGGRRLDASFVFVNEMSVVEGHRNSIYPYGEGESGTTPPPTGTGPTLLDVCDNPLVWSASWVGCLYSACCWDGFLPALSVTWTFYVGALTH